MDRRHIGLMVAVAGVLAAADGAIIGRDIQIRPREPAPELSDSRLGISGSSFGARSRNWPARTVAQDKRDAQKARNRKRSKLRA